MREVVLDTETTGLDIAIGHKLVEIACVELKDLELTGRTWSTCLNPRRPCSVESLEIHRLSDRFLSRQPLFGEKVHELLAFLADSRIVMHNAEFDLKFINNELRQAGLDRISGRRVTDSLHLARRLHPGVSNTLDSLAERYGVSTSKFRTHRALPDAMLLARVYPCLRRTGDRVMPPTGDSAGHA